MMEKLEKAKRRKRVNLILICYLCVQTNLGGLVASWLVCSTLERAVQVQALAGDIVLCSGARHFTLTVPHSTQVYKWVPANLMLALTL